jgi:phenylalanyl-tRNA synthetase alpha chain
VVDDGITLGDLQGTLDYLLRALFGEQRRTEFRTHFFPFTEPSIEAYVSCHVCDGAGCPVCRHSGWIEVGGAGMVDPKLFEFVGYDSERWTGFAFGWGLERIAVLRHGIPDLRELWRNDPRLLGQF